MPETWTQKVVLQRSCRVCGGSVAGLSEHTDKAECIRELLSLCGSLGSRIARLESQLRDIETERRRARK